MHDVHVQGYGGNMIFYIQQQLFKCLFTAKLRDATTLTVQPNADFIT